VLDRTFITVASVLAVLFIAVGGLFAYDRSHQNRIAKGVRVAGVEVGGLTAPQAHQRLVRVLTAELDHPILVRGGGRSFRLTPEAVAATYDFDGMVREALRRSRQGNVFSRTWRDVRGEPLRVNLPGNLRYSRLVVSRFVGRVARAVSRPPVDAHLDFNGGLFTRVAGKEGVLVNRRRLQRTVTAALTGKSPSRLVTVPTRLVKPKVLKAELAKAYPFLLTIDRSSFAGMYHIQNKAVDPAWSVPDKPWAGSLAGQVIPGGSPENPLKARWLGIANGAGIHGTAETGSLGHAASHGCIRMAIPDVIELYKRVPVHTPVHIA
jgi:L,D-transpeptidase catalytic domain/Putative peptidoglycan binding domain